MAGSKTSQACRYLLMKGRGMGKSTGPLFVIAFPIAASIVAGGWAIFTYLHPAPAPAPALSPATNPTPFTIVANGAGMVAQHDINISLAKGSDPREKATTNITHGDKSPIIQGNTGTIAIK
jgi:hypothetical protein